jgi:Protein of unknown function (DUF1553)/Protein of unknown function (DUF1549)/Planctomycete cytochrome C
MTFFEVIRQTKIYPAARLAGVWSFVVFTCVYFCAGEDLSGVDFFESKIRPVLVERCYSCHSVESKEANGELVVDSSPALLRGGSRGPAIRADSAQDSLLLKAIEYGDGDLQMPPDGRMPQAIIDDFRKWLEMGAPDPRQQETGAAISKPSVAEQAASHWSYQPPRLNAIPSVKNPAWPQTDIDYLVLAKLEAAGLSPNGQSDRRTLIRRLYYDLVGLPPSFEAIESFESDDSPTAFETLVDGVLAQSAFGERFARHWMDVTRYADTKGYVFTEDRNYPQAFRYRDWLIRAFNDDLPYDQFLRYQLAADRLDPENAQGNLAAMGALTLGRRFLNNPNDIADDRIDVVTRGFMGMTVGCARCHDHKFDPVNMADYYSLHGVFVNSEEPGGDPSPLRLVDRKDQRPSRIFLRGNQGNQGPEIERRFVSFLSKESPRPLNDGSGRLDLANAICDPTNPLTARVYVNRVWGWLFGVPLVDTPSDFGMRCEQPVQQDVLDRLAIQFIEDGWSTKRLIKRMLMSATYQQSSLSQSLALEVDPENRLLWRSQRKRMDFESYRDALLAVSGRLDSGVIGGPSQPIHEKPFSTRRTLYAHIDRQNLPNIFRTFDVANPDSHTPQRSVTTVPQQGLFILNSEEVFEIANDTAKRVTAVLQEKPSTDASVLLAAIDQLYRRVLARQPLPEEAQMCLEFLRNEGLPRSPTWQYGYAHFDGKRLSDFKRLPVFHENRWSGGVQLPDERLGWALLSPDGGHPGTSPEYAVVRRWTAPRDGIVRLRGKLAHAADQGDGVRATVARNEIELLGNWICKHNEHVTLIDSITVQAGDTLDLIVDSQADTNSDTFDWTVQIKYTEGDLVEYRSRRDFQTLSTELSDAWTQLAQALLATNEFCFID